MQFIDTHIHLQDYKTRYAREIIASAASQGVKKFVCAGTKPADWQQVAELYETFPEQVVPTFGLHPWYVEDAPQNWEAQLVEWLEKYPQALIGECGLDGHRSKNPEPQNRIFQKHLELAEKYRRPLLIHAVKCWEWMEQYWPRMSEKFVFHSFASSREVLQKIVSHGGYVSFSFSILAKAGKGQIIAAAPREKILLETDGPYQSPEKGTETSPENLPRLAAEIAALRREPLADFSAQVYQNSEEFVNVRK